MPIIAKPDLLVKGRKENAVRLFFLPDEQVNIEGSDTVVCGEFNLVATGMTLSDVSRLLFLLRFPFRITPWPFDEEYSREKFADLYIKITGNDWWT